MSMRICAGCGNRIPAHIVAILIGTIEQSSGPGIPQFRHKECKVAATSMTTPTPQVGIRRAP